MSNTVEINESLKLTADGDKATLSQHKGYDVYHDVKLSLEDAERIVKYLKKENR